MGDLFGKDHHAPVLDGPSSTRSGSCISARTVNTSLEPMAIADMMTPPLAGEEEAIEDPCHEEKLKTNSNVNLQPSGDEPITGYVHNPHKDGNDDTYGECFYVSSPYPATLRRASAAAEAPLSPASARETKSSLSSRERESEEIKETDDSEEDLQGISVKSCGSRDLPSGLRESHLQAKRAFLGQFNPLEFKPPHRLHQKQSARVAAREKPPPSDLWQQSQYVCENILGKHCPHGVHKYKNHTNESMSLQAFLGMNRKQRRHPISAARAQRPLWAAVDTGAATTCVTDDFPIQLDHARPPRPEEHMIGINGTPEAPVEVGDFTIDAVDPVTQEPLEPIRIRNATKLKNSPINLLSVSMMTSSGCSFYFGPDAAWMKYNGVKYELKQRRGIYYLRIDNALGSDLVHGLAALNPDWYDACDDGDGNLVAMGASMDVWHKRFGHVSPKTVKFIFDNDAVTGMDVKGKDNPHTPECKCPQCMQLKAKRVHIGDYRPDREHHATQIGETVHCDLHGPMPVSITTGASYYMSVIDEASRWSLIYFLEHKDDAVLAMKEAIKYFHMHGHVVKTVQTDGGGEFGGAQETSTGKKNVHSGAEEPWCRTTEWNEMLTANKVFHRITPAGVKELNGIAESYNRTLLLLGNALLFNARIAPGLFCEAFAHANFLRNRLPVPHVKGAVTPYQLFHKRTYDARFLRTFGCDCYAVQVLPKTGETKNLPGHAPGKRYIYIGESASGRMGFRCLDPETLRVKTLLHVSFDENSIEHRRDKLREWDRRADAFRKNQLGDLPLIQDDWEMYAKDHDEFAKAREVRRLFVDYDRPFE
ncbi:MAG: hypothetical protein VXV91_00915, partial [Verrucomicrobiota bacterium]|nr:hypothetical protein [Verrucomicrobiota bacterium]